MVTDHLLTEIYGIGGLAVSTSIRRKKGPNFRTIFIVLFFAFFVSNVPADAATAVSWSPPNVSATLAPGEVQTVQATFNVFKDQGDIWVRVVPELQPYISVSPAEFPGVLAGDSLTIEISVSAPLDTEFQVLDGTIQLRKGKRALSVPLPLVITVREDPLIGVDSNGDGIWDFIELYIDQHYGQPDSTRNALRQFALGMQQAVVAADDPQVCFDNATAIQRSIECLSFHRPYDSRQLKNDIKAAFLNTRERTFAYLHFNDQLAGQIFPSTPLSELESACAW